MTELINCGYTFLLSIILMVVNAFYTRFHFWCMLEYLTEFINSQTVCLFTTISKSLIKKVSTL